jgi:2-polyprenyl-3-methyl-5-hydroxy-6-metoxy-1,4-benzoquinol methylase
MSVGIRQALNNLTDLLIKKQSDSLPFVFDFTAYAYKNDPLEHLFPEWKLYYNLKYLICQSLNLKSILEIGVRYGYSAAAFLSACPGARYVGIDNGSALFGGVAGACEIARKTLSPFDAEIIIADSQRLSQFPGGFYDLIHVDGQQDGDGTMHDMEIAAKQCDWIWVDGCFWTKENLLATAYFLDKYKNFIDFSLAIPGYAGEMLIHVNGARRPAMTGKTNSYENLASEYSAFYYLNDCGGHSQFKQHKGEQLDERLSVLFDLADVEPGENVLDIGCGHGELSYFISKHTHAGKVIGVDYSADAIEIAREAFLGNAASLRLDYEQSDILMYAPQIKFDKVIAADVIEHIEQTNLERMFDKISSELLSENGMFVGHTAPNRMRYDIGYEMRRREAKRLDLYLPKNPRSVYEDLMHINEQSEPSLNAALRKYFKYVYTWLPLDGDFFGTLKQSAFLFDSIYSNDIYLLASNTPMNLDKIYGLCEQRELGDIKPGEIELAVSSREISAAPNQNLKLPVTLENKSVFSMSSHPPYPVHLSYHINDRRENTVVFDGIRTALPCRIKPNTSREIICDIRTPPDPGEYVIRLTLVQEQCFWFDDRVDGIALDVLLCLFE